MGTLCTHIYPVVVRRHHRFKLSLLELLEKLAAIVPLPRAHLLRYGSCLAPHSTLRAAIIPTLRQQGVDGDEVNTGTPYWN